MIKVFIIDDHRIVLDGLVNLIQADKDLEICGTASGYSEFMDKIQSCSPDVILSDISLPGKSGIEILKEITNRLPNAGTIMLSMYTDEEFIFNAINSGARGYLPKNISGTELINAIKTVAGGGEYFSNDISKKVLSSYIKKARNPEENPSATSLSEREKEILKLYAEGKSNGEIADALFISIRTVESHKNHIMHKLNLKNPVDLVKFAIKNKYIEL
jgi:two-component system response regulator NreC